MGSPIKVKLERRLVHTLRIELPGYCREMVYLDRIHQNSSLLDPPAEWTSDPALGGVHRLVPKNVYVHLWPVDAPDRICGPIGSDLRDAPTPAP